MKPDVFLIKVKSSAISYAITFMLLIGLICSGLLFIASANKRIELIYNMKEYLIFDNAYALRFAAQNSTFDSIRLEHPSGDTSYIKKKKWGAYDVIFCLTKNKMNELSRAALIGFSSSENLPALYLQDNNQALKLSGNTKIEGGTFLPERGVERAYIAGKNYTNDKLIYGNISTSKSYLPKVKESLSKLTFESLIKDAKKIEFKDKDSTYSFNEKTSYISQIEPLELNNNFSGNIIFHSFDSIYVRRNSSLNNVILIAPIIHFEKGFKGNVQAIASKKIFIESDVTLQYPSTLMLNDYSVIEQGFKSSIQIEENAKVIGGILMIQKIVDFRNIPRLTLKKNSLVAGIIYNTGETELGGKISGSLFSNKMYLNAGGGIYYNHILDAQISNLDLPANFLYPLWLENMNSKQSKLIKCF